MKQLQLTFLLLFTALFALKTIANDSGITHEYHSLNSTLSTQKLKIEVILPWGYEANKKYPVLYTTAGTTRITLLKHQVDWLSHVNMGSMPQMIIVRVPSIEVPSELHPKFIAASGIANQITFSVITKELMPFIESKYKTQGFNILEGYSSNGNFVLYAFAQKEKQFDAYIASSPALELDKSGLISSLLKVEAPEAQPHPWIYLSLGPFVNNKPIFEKLKTHFSNKYTGTLFEDFSKNNFLTVANLSFVNAVQTLFSDRSPSPDMFAETGIKGIEDYFENLSIKYKKTLNADPTKVSLSFYYANKKQTVKALEVIDHVIKNNPESTYYIGRKAVIQQQASLITESRTTLKKGLELALKQNNEDASQYFKGELSKL